MGIFSKREQPPEPDRATNSETNHWKIYWDQLAEAADAVDLSMKRVITCMAALEEAELQTDAQSERESLRAVQSDYVREALVASRQYVGLRDFHRSSGKTFDWIDSDPESAANISRQLWQANMHDRGDR